MFQRRRPIFQKVSKLLKVSILRRPIIPRLKFHIKSRRRSSAKRVKLLQQYKFLQEYQFSSSESLIRHRRKRIRISRSCLKRIYGLLCLSKCIGPVNDECGDDRVLTQSWMEMEPLNYVVEVASSARELSQPFDYFDEDDLIDLKAERFIEKFYHEMRMQAREFT